MWSMSWNLRWSIWDCSVTGDWPSSKRSMNRRCSCCYSISKVAPPPAVSYSRGGGRAQGHSVPHVSLLCCAQSLLTDALDFHTHGYRVSCHSDVRWLMFEVPSLCLLPDPQELLKSCWFVVGLAFMWKCKTTSGIFKYRWSDRLCCNFFSWV